MFKNCILKQTHKGKCIIKTAIYKIQHSVVIIKYICFPLLIHLGYKGGDIA